MCFYIKYSTSTASYFSLLLCFVFICCTEYCSCDIILFLGLSHTKQLNLLPTEESIVDESDIEGLEWATWTGVLGTPVAGIWHKYADVSDVNTCDANFQSSVVVTGDDYGLVKLFRFPCPKRGRLDVEAVSCVVISIWHLLLYFSLILMYPHFPNHPTIQHV